MVAARLARSPLSIADEVFRSLTTPPDPLALDAAELGLGPAGSLVALDQLRDLLRSPATSIEVKNRAWQVLIERAQQHGQGWTVAAVGVALPRLVRLGAELAEGNQLSRPDLDAEILTGFLTALVGADTDNSRRFPVLLRAAREAGLAWLRHIRASDTPLCDLEDHASTPPPPQWSHPDLVLADAVVAGVITSAEAQLIGATRLERQPLRHLAVQMGVAAKTLWMRRDRAERRLVAALRAAAAPDDTDRTQDPTHAEVLATTPLAERVRVTGSLRAPAPRHAPGSATPREDTSSGAVGGKTGESAPWYSQDGLRPQPTAATDTPRRPGAHSEENAA
jgi:hypothetical protein